MPTLEVQSHEISQTSATTAGYAPRIHLQSRCKETATPTTIWLHFEAVPNLYASKGGIGFGKAGETAAKYWVYLDQSTFEEVSAALAADRSVNVNLSEHQHPGAAGANRLVTNVELALDAKVGTAGRNRSLKFPSVYPVLFAAV